MSDASAWISATYSRPGSMSMSDSMATKPHDFGRNIPLAGLSRIGCAVPADLVSWLASEVPH